MSLFTPPDLVGAWAFRRSIDDRLAAQSIDVDGTAAFVRRDDATIDWREEGLMRLPEGTVPVTTHRVLRWSVDGSKRDGAGSWSVDFADGRGFHTWATGVPLIHDCAPDVYRGLLEGVGAFGVLGAFGAFGVRGGRDPAPEAWTMRWDALGPAKDYTIETTYRRVSSG